MSFCLLCSPRCGSGEAQRVKLLALMSHRRYGTRPPRGHSAPALAVALISAVAVGACTENIVATAPPEAHVDPAYVAGDAARALDASGQIVLPAPDLSGPYPQLSQDQALALAKGIVKDFAHFTLHSFEREHGAPIDLASLQACPRLYYAQSAYQPPSPSIDPAARNFVGPYWLVSFCSPNGVPTLSVPVAAYATNMIIENGHIRWTSDTQIRGNETFPMGIPLGVDYPISPERAIALVANETQRQVVGIPELVQRKVGYPPQYAVWKLTLDAPVHVRGVERATESDEQTLYVGANEFAPAEIAVFRGNPATGNEPSEVVRTSSGGDTRGLVVNMPLSRRGGVPRALERITIVPMGR